MQGVDRTSGHCHCLCHCLRSSGKKGSEGKRKLTSHIRKEERTQRVREKLRKCWRETTTYFQDILASGSGVVSVMAYCMVRCMFFGTSHIIQCLVSHDAFGRHRCTWIDGSGARTLYTVRFWFSCGVFFVVKDTVFNDV